jgi:hypothetical protein
MTRTHTQEEQDWTFKNKFTSVTKLIKYQLTMTDDIQVVILIHDPTTRPFNEYKYTQRGVTGDIEYEDEDKTFCKKYGKKQAGASDFFVVARKESEAGDLEPTVEHVQVGEEATEKDVYVRKNLLPNGKFTSYGVGSMLEYVLWRILIFSLCFQKY